MKTKIMPVIAAAALFALSACADLGFGVDVDSGSGMNPYWYGNGYLGDTYWHTPVWNYGPIYNPYPISPPPIINNGIGPVRPPANINPGLNRPPQINVSPGENPGVNRPQVPSGGGSSINGVQRPGNNGLPNNARRGT